MSVMRRMTSGLLEHRVEGTFKAQIATTLLSLVCEAPARFPAAPAGF